MAVLNSLKFLERKYNASNPNIFSQKTWVEMGLGWVGPGLGWTWVEMGLGWDGPWLGWAWVGLTHHPVQYMYVEVVSLLFSDF